MVWGRHQQPGKKISENLGEKFNAYCPELFKMSEGMTYPQVYRAFEQYCEQFNEPIHLCGLSLCGIMALQYAIENPEKVESLVLIGTRYKMPRMLFHFQNLMFHFVSNKSFEKMGVKKKDVIKLTTSMINLDFEADLEKIYCPALVVCGEEDRVNMDSSSKMAKLLPKSKLKVIPKAGHAVNHDQPEALAEAIKEFYQ